MKMKQYRVVILVNEESSKCWLSEQNKNGFYVFKEIFDNLKEAEEFATDYTQWHPGEEFKVQERNIVVSEWKDKEFKT